MDTSLSRVRESERQDESETGTKSGTERTEAQDEVEEGIVILILRIRLHRSCTYIGYVIDNDQYATWSMIRRTTSQKRGASTHGYETGEIQVKQKEL